MECSDDALSATRNIMTDAGVLKEIWLAAPGTSVCPLVMAWEPTRDRLRQSQYDIVQHEEVCHTTAPCKREICKCRGAVSSCTSIPYTSLHKLRAQVASE